MRREAFAAKELTCGAVSLLAVVAVFSDTNLNSVIWLLKLPEIFQAGQNLWCPYPCCETA